VTIAAGLTYGPTSSINGFVGISRVDFVEVSYDHFLQGALLVQDISNGDGVQVKLYNSLQIRLRRLRQTPFVSV
jgi:hypothetical protein